MTELGELGQDGDGVEAGRWVEHLFLFQKQTSSSKLYLNILNLKNNAHLNCVYIIDDYTYFLFIYL